MRGGTKGVFFNCMIKEITPEGYDKKRSAHNELKLVQISSPELENDIIP